MPTISDLSSCLEFERSVETDLPEIIVECTCDERVHTAFLTRRDAPPFAKGLRDLRFAWTRPAVRDHLGVPERSGPRHDGHAIHARSDLDRGEIARITSMGEDMLP